jgi:hypothetical protein
MLTSHFDVQHYIQFGYNVVFFVYSYQQLQMVYYYTVSDTVS